MMVNKERTTLKVILYVKHFYCHYLGDLEFIQDRSEMGNLELFSYSLLMLDIEVIME